LENKSILIPLNPALKAPDSFQTTIIIAEKVSMKRMIAATLMFSLLLSATACGKAPFKSFLLGRACPKPCQERVRQTGSC